MMTRLSTAFIAGFGVALLLSISAARAQFLPLGGGWMGIQPRGIPLERPPVQAFNPDNGHQYVTRQCANARSGMDKDECQYNSQNKIAQMRECIAAGGPQARRCAQLLPVYQRQLARVNRDPTLLDHRAGQREGSRQGSIRSLCASQNGGFHAGNYAGCVRGYGVNP
jgi:hypothetical protein